MGIQLHLCINIERFRRGVWAPVRRFWCAGSSQGQESQNRTLLPFPEAVPLLKLPAFWTTDVFLESALDSHRGQSLHRLPLYRTAAMHLWLSLHFIPDVVRMRLARCIPYSDTMEDSSSMPLNSWDIWALCTWSVSSWSVMPTTRRLAAIKAASQDGNETFLHTSGRLILS